MATITKQELIDELKEELAAIKTAITAAQKQQSYDLADGQGTQKVTKGKLDDLYRERERLRSEIIQLEQGSQGGFYARPC